MKTEILNKLFKNRTAKNAGWLIFGRIAQMVISLFVGTITARYLGPSNYGLIGYAGSYSAFFMAFCTLGINSLLVKELVQNPKQEGEILGTALLLRIISSICSVFIIFCIVSVVDAGEKTTVLVVLLCNISTIFNAFEIFNFWFQSKLKSKVTAIVSLIAYIVTAIYKIILLILGKSVLWLAFATSVDYICVAVLLCLVYFKSGGSGLNFSAGYAKRLLSQSYHFILSSIMVAVYANTDKLMLKHMISQSEVGYYSTATTVSTMWCFIISAIIDSMVPSIVETYGKDEKLFVKRNIQLYCIVFYFAMFVSFVITVFAPLIIRILYGQAYLPSINPLRIVTWYTAFSYLGVSRNAWLVCKNRQQYLKYIYFLAMLANVALNLILIPIWGASGAALASLVSQILTSIILPFCIKDLRENSIMMLKAIVLKGIK